MLDIEDGVADDVEAIFGREFVRIPNYTSWFYLFIYFSVHLLAQQDSGFPGLWQRVGASQWRVLLINSKQRVVFYV